MRMKRLSRGCAIMWMALGACGDSAAPLGDGAADAGVDAGGPAHSDAGAAVSGEVLVLGDSYMTWNEERGSSIPMVLAEELAVPVRSEAVPGSQLTATEEPIPSQYRDGDWSWVVLDGGGNDVNDLCRCADCGELLDEILTADGSSGVLVDFVEGVVSGRRRVAFLGYPTLPEGAEFGFHRCGEELATLSDRVADYAARTEGMIFVDGRLAVTDLDGFDDDRVHPSVRGSTALGRALAAAIRAAGP